MKIVVTEAQKAKARAIVRQAVADGRTPNPATVALAAGDTAELARIASTLKPIKAAKENKIK